MRRPLFIIGIAAAILVLCVVIGRVTGMLTMCSMPTSANEPAFKVGQTFWASNLKTPQRLDFILYRRLNEITGTEEIFLHRLCGVENDIIEIKNGDLYVNGGMVDSKLNLQHRYQVPKDETHKLQDFYTDHPFQMQIDDRGSVTGIFPTSLLKEKRIAATRIVLSASEKDEYISRIFGQPWNADHFGPIKVPKGRLFVLGDNRSASQDSRYTGFINQSQVVGVALGNK